MTLRQFRVPFGHLGERLLDEGAHEVVGLHAEPLALYASNYGEAGAINLFGPALGLPPAICAHQTHSMWGPPADEPETVIWLQWRREHLEELCACVEEVGRLHHPWGMAEENRPIYLCRRPLRPLAEMWPDLTHWN